jgi:hypothetical protein
MPGDGECFGEMSLFDFNKIIVNDNNSKIADSSKNLTISKQPDVKPRAATCIAVELTYLLRLNHAKAREILQPNFKQTKKTYSSSKSASSFSSEIQNSKSYLSSAINE